MNRNAFSKKLETLLRRKTFRYLISGVTSQIIDFTSFLLLLFLTGHLVFSNSTSFIIGIASGFVLHKLWSFKGDQQFRTHFQIIGYATLSVFNFMATNLLVNSLVGIFHTPAPVAKLATMTIIAVWSFILFNMVIFRHKTSGK